MRAEIMVCYYGCPLPPDLVPGLRWDVREFWAPGLLDAQLVLLNAEGEVRWRVTPVPPRGLVVRRLQLWHWDVEGDRFGASFVGMKQILAYIRAYEDCYRRRFDQCSFGFDVQIGACDRRVLP